MDQNSSLDSFLQGYSASSRTAAEAALANLNTGLNWALTLCLGVAAFVLQVMTKDNGPSDKQLALALAIIALTLAMLVHFAVRTAKNYLNLIRFALLERVALRAQLRLPDSPDPQRAVQLYHLEWKSPIGLGRISWKVLLELGFLYLFALMGLMFLIVARELYSTRCFVVGCLSMLVLIAASVEIVIFLGSPYLQSQVIDDEATRQA